MEEAAEGREGEERVKEWGCWQEECEMSGHVLDVCDCLMVGSPIWAL